MINLNGMKKEAFLGAAANAVLSTMGIGSQIKENKANAQLDQPRQVADLMQLPGTEGMRFEGGKRIDNQSITAVNRY